MPVDFFFYGTLRDAEVRRIVLGPGAVTLAAEPAVLEGYRCAPAEGGRFPGIVAEEGAVAAGVLVRGVPLDAAARISYFEGDGADYDIVPKMVGLGGGRQARAWVCLPANSLPVEAGQWRFDDWRRRWRSAFLENVRAAMARAAPAEYGRYRRAWLGRLSRARKP